MGKDLKIICEIASNHWGRVERLATIVDYVKFLKPDSVKFQIYDPESLYDNNSQEFKMFQSLGISPEIWINLINDLLINTDIEVIVEPYDDLFLLDVCPHLIRNLSIKVPPARILDPEFLRYYRDYCAVADRVFVGVSGAYDSEIEKCLKILDTSISMIYGFQNFPSNMSDVNFSRITHLKKTFGVPIGYADHTFSGDPNRDLGCRLAMCYGAEFLEKHLCLSRVTEEPDNICGLNPQEFVEFMESMRDQNVTVYGGSGSQPAEAELDYRCKMFCFAEEESEDNTTTTEFSRKRKRLFLSWSQRRMER